MRIYQLIAKYKLNNVPDVYKPMPLDEFANFIQIEYEKFVNFHYGDSMCYEENKKYYRDKINNLTPDYLHSLPIGRTHISETEYSTHHGNCYYFYIYVSDINIKTLVYWTVMSYGDYCEVIINPTTLTKFIKELHNCMIHTHQNYRRQKMISL